MIRTALLLFGTLLAADRSGAQPHAPPPAYAETIVATPDTDVWLARLLGRFRLDGSQQTELTISTRRGPPIHLILPSLAATGKADCLSVSDDAGLQCVLDVSYPASGRAELGENLTPALLLAGLAPSTGEIRFLLVDSRGLAHPGSGKLAGDTAIAEFPCVNRPGTLVCKITVRIEAGGEAGSFYAHVITATTTRGRDGPIERLTDLSVVLHREAQTTGEGQAPPVGLP